MRTHSCWAVVFCHQNDLIYQGVNIFVNCLGISTFFFLFNDSASFQFWVYLGKKKNKKQKTNFICLGVLVCFGIVLLPGKGPQKLILHSCVQAKLCRENLLHALVDVHTGSMLCGGTGDGRERRLRVI